MNARPRASEVSSARAFSTPSCGVGATSVKLRPKARAISSSVSAARSARTPRRRSAHRTAPVSRSSQTLRFRPSPRVPYVSSCAALPSPSASSRGVAIRTGGGASGAASVGTWASRAVGPDSTGPDSSEVMPAPYPRAAQKASTESSEPKGVGGEGVRRTEASAPPGVRSGRGVQAAWPWRSVAAREAAFQGALHDFQQAADRPVDQGRREVRPERLEGPRDHQLRAA